MQMECLDNLLLGVGVHPSVLKNADKFLSLEFSFEQSLIPPCMLKDSWSLIDGIASIRVIVSKQKIV